MTPPPLRILTQIPPDALPARVRAMEGVELVRVPTEGEPEPGVEGEVLLTFAWGSENLERLVARGVAWIHTIGTGVDRFPLHAVGSRQLTCARGATAVPIAEWVMAVMLAFEKRLPEAFVREPPAVWNRFDLGGLAGRRLGLVGLGSIAREVAHRALPFGMRVAALRRRPLPSPVDGVEIRTDLHALLADADHVVVAASATHATRHLLGAEALAHVKPGVHLVNVARGSLVDADALRAALDDGRVARASLDTVEPEPLPAGHWMYAHPRVRLSPHVSWNAPGAVEALFETFADNLVRYRAGEPLMGRVDVEAGY